MKLNKWTSMLSISAVTLLLGAPLAQAVPFTVDTLLGSDNLGNSGDAAELALIKLKSGDNTLTLDFKIDTPNPAAVVGVNEAGTSWFIDVAPATPGYFLLKFGTGSTTVTNDTYVFQNIGELTKLVWSNGQVNNLTGGDCGAANPNACNIEKLSHYVGTKGGNTPTEIPEPMSLLLIGTGLLGFAAARRRRLV